MTCLTAIVAALGTLVSLGVWWGCNWLDARMDADDRRADGYDE